MFSLLAHVIVALTHLIGIFLRRTDKLEPAGKPYPTCKCCGGHWHGLPDRYDGCPGAFASEAEITGWQQQRQLAVLATTNGHGYGYGYADE